MYQKNVKIEAWEKFASCLKTLGCSYGYSQCMEPDGTTCWRVWVRKERHFSIAIAQKQIHALFLATLNLTDAGALDEKLFNDWLFEKHT